MNDMNEPMAEATPSASSVEEVQNEVPRTDLTLFAEIAVLTALFLPVKTQMAQV